MAISDNDNDHDDNDSDYNSDGNSYGNSACNCVNGKSDCGSVEQCKVATFSGTCDVESVACDFNYGYALPNVASTQSEHQRTQSDYQT